MDPSELRIGNYVFADGMMTEVIAIEVDDIVVRRDDGTMSVKFNNIQLAPIPLSKDALYLCCKFNKYGTLPLKLHPYLYALKIVENHIVVLDDKGTPTMHFWDVKALHKLQNLYFALKEEDLEIVIPAGF